MQLNDVGFQITRYYHTSLGTERDRILLKRESGRLAKAVIEYLGCKCNQVGVAVAEFLQSSSVILCRNSASFSPLLYFCAFWIIAVSTAL